MSVCIQGRPYTNVIPKGAQAEKMKVLLFLTVTSACVIIGLDARIDNKYGTGRKKQRNSHPLENNRDAPLVPHSGELPVTKVKGHTTKEKSHHDNNGVHGHNGHHGNRKASPEHGRGHHGIDYGRDHGIDHGMDHGRDHGIDHGLDHRATHTKHDDNHIVSKKQITHGKWKMKKSQNKHRNNPAKKDWKKGPEHGVCEKLRCRRKQICLVNGVTGLAECVSRKLLRQRKKMAKHNANDGKTMDKKHLKKFKNVDGPRGHMKKMADKKTTSQHTKAHRLAKKIKHKAEKFQHKYSEKKRHHLHHFQVTGVHKDLYASTHETPLKSVDSTASHQNTHCSKKDLSEMGRRLLDWFKLLQERSPNNPPHSITKRNSQKKELHERDDCICQSPVRSEFLRLDKDRDDVLSSSELVSLESNGYEHCILPFIQSCDHDQNGKLSDKEWCCCFASVLPPCLAEMINVPAAVSLGEKTSIMPGAYVPQCDEDGFYKTVQCHSSTGFCWCVDRHGLQIDGSHTRGTPTCGPEKQFDTTENDLELDLLE